MREYFQVFFAFLRVGALTFGGGYAMLPILRREVLEKYGWITEAEMLDYYAMAQCLPGIIMVNTSVFIGQKHKGNMGGIVAAIGVVFPSLVIIIAVASCLMAFSDVPVIKNAFAGIRVCVVVMIINSIIKLWKTAIIDWKCFGIFLIVSALSVFTDISPILFVIGAAATGIAVKSLEASAK